MGEKEASMNAKDIREGKRDSVITATPVLVIGYLKKKELGNNFMPFYTFLIINYGMFTGYVSL